MPTPQFSHVIETVEQLESSINHMEVKWNLFYSKGYLPITDIFTRLEQKITELKNDIGYTRSIYLQIFNGNFPNELILEDNKYMYKKSKKYNKLLFKSDLSSEDLHELKGSDLKFRIKALNNITNNLYYDVETISDMHNALNYCFISRISGVFSPEATFAKDIATKKFGGIKLVYDAAEALIKDYADSFINANYDGLVVFGFRNRAVSYPISLVVFPAYSEHDLEFFTILSHECFHSIQNNIAERINKKDLNNLPLDDIEKTMVKIKSNLRSNLIWLGDIYRNEDYNDKNIPQKIVAESLANELMADIYGTFVAGDSYPLMLYNYYLPILFNIESGYWTGYDYSAFSLGSLKLRVSLTTLKEIFKLRGYHTEQLELRICGKNVNVFDYLYREVEKWENISTNLLRVQLDEKYNLRSKKVKKGKSDDEIKIIVNGKKVHIKEEILRICEKIEDDEVIQNMDKLVTHPFYPKEMPFDEFEENV